MVGASYFDISEIKGLQKSKPQSILNDKLSLIRTVGFVPFCSDVIFKDRKLLDILAYAPTLERDGDQRPSGKV